MFDKYGTCKDCPDRVVGCHGTCEGYISRCEERKEARRIESLNRWKPTEHQKQATINFYKKQKKFRNW